MEQGHVQQKAQRLTPGSSAASDSSAATRYLAFRIRERATCSAAIPTL
jgi:hypothetical protein